MYGGVGFGQSPVTHMAELSLLTNCNDASAELFEKNLTLSSRGKLCPFKANRDTWNLH
jgi:hypothetical protein